jgi:pilus assembly protein CpaF
VIEAALKNQILNETLDGLIDETLENALTKTLERHPELTLEPAARDILLSELNGNGPVENLLKDDSITEIIVHGHSEILFERSGDLQRSESRFASPRTFQLFLNRLLLEMEKSADRQNPLLDGVLADGTRVHIALPPASEWPVVTLRKHRRHHWTLSRLIELGMLNQVTASRLSQALLSGKNILVCGGTGSGKTTLMRAMLSEIPDSQRIITIEDTPELGLQGSNRVSLKTRIAQRGEIVEITLVDLLKNSLRMRPDRLVVGEIRGEEALVFLDAVATGHQGSMSSIHGGTCQQALRRLEALALRAAPHWGMTAIRQTIRESVNVVVCLARENKNRRVREIVELSGLEDFGYLLNPWILEDA